VIAADGSLVSSNLYTASHQVATNFNANGEMTVYRYDSSGRLTNTISPTGLTSYRLFHTNSADTNNYGFLPSAIDVGFRTNSFAYAKGLVSVQTNELGLDLGGVPHIRICGTDSCCPNKLEISPVRGNAVTHVRVFDDDNG
jgi:YD repeat-containing protein